MDLGDNIVPIPPSRVMIVAVVIMVRLWLVVVRIMIRMVVVIVPI